MSVDNLVSYRDLELPRSRLGKGLFWPPQEDETTGDLKKADQEESITVCIRHLIETYIGEYPVIRTFGTRVEDLLFARVQDALLNAIYGSVREGIQKFEQRVDLINLILETEQGQRPGQKANLNIRYRIRATGQIKTNVTPVDLSSLAAETVPQ